MIAKKYDAIIILGGGLRKEGEEYFPARYEDTDDFGMLGGHLRVQAAADLYKMGAADTFVFTTGVYEKNKAKFGADVPAEANIYSKSFTDALSAENLPVPQIILENRSTTTLTNIQEVLDIIGANDWKHVGIVSSEYHLPRVRALYQKILQQHPEFLCQIDFISAEDIVRQSHPGVFDDEIKNAYSSTEGLKRIANEAHGLKDIEAGTYALVEFQIAQKSSRERK